MIEYAICMPKLIPCWYQLVEHSHLIVASTINLGGSIGRRAMFIEGFGD